MTLTPAGRRFLPALRPRFEAVRRGVPETRRPPREGTRWRACASALATISRCTSPPSRSRACARAPDVEINVRSGRSHAVAEALRADEIEIALVSQLVALPELASRPLFEEQMSVVVGRGHVFAAPGRVGIEEMARAGLVMRDPTAYLHAITTQYFAAAGTAPRILMELNNTEACKRVVLAGLGAALLPQMAIHEELRRGDLVALQVDGHPAPKRTIHLMTRAAPRSRRPRTRS